MPSLTRGEWITLTIFLLALSLNGLLINDAVQRSLGLCGDGFAQTPCEEEVEEEEEEHE
jgi:hypothetical protein